jgi:hypothetical protein
MNNYVRASSTEKKVSETLTYKYVLALFFLAFVDDVNVCELNPVEISNLIFCVT